MRMHLPHDETDESRRYTMPDPDALADAFAAVYRHRYHGERAPTLGEIAGVLTLASGYLDLTTFPLGQECCVGKLRDVWRARRARQSDGADGAGELDGSGL